MLNTPFDWQWTEKMEEAKFSTGIHRYSVTFERHGGCVEVHFFADDFDWPLSMGITKSGNALKVLATVVEIIKSFITNSDTDMLCFTADEESRQSLYRRMLTRITKPKFTFTYDNEDRVFCLIFEKE